MKGYLMQMQPFSVNDGDGIRTTIFLAGCPLHCKWCANPEGLRQPPVVGFYARLCIGCGACYQACPQRGIHLRREDNPIGARCANKDARCRDVCAVSCIGCGLCKKVCPKDAITVEKNLARIDYSKCDNCGLCATVCPKKLIRDSNVENLGAPKPVVRAKPPSKLRGRSLRRTAASSMDAVWATA